MFSWIFSKKQNRSPPKYGTQMWAVRSDYLMQLSANMPKIPACDIDMYLMWRAPGNNITALSTSIAGQDRHWSDCNVHGHFMEKYEVKPQAIVDLTCTRLEPEKRQLEWQKYTQREPQIFE